MNGRAGKRDPAAVAVPPLPDGEANQLETGELAGDEVDLCVGQLARRFSVLVAKNLDFDVHGIPPEKWPDRARSGLVLFALLCVREFEIGRGRSDPVPQPVLQRVQSNEHGIGRCEEVALLAVACALPVEFGGIDENKTCG